MPYGVLGGASSEMPRDASHQSEVEYNSVGSNYSSETFESFTEELEEVEEQCQLNEGEASGSLISSEECQTSSCASGSYPLSKKLMLGLRDGDEPVNPLDSAALEEKLSQKWIQLLKDKENQTGQSQTDPMFQAHVMEASKSDEDDVLQAFCARKINLIRHQLNPQEMNGGSSRKRPQLGLDAGKPVTDEVNNCVVPPQLINRIFLQNLRATPSKASGVREHKCSRCPECTKKRGELSQLTFLRQKKTFLESALLQEKMEEHHLAKDLLSFIVDIHQSLPRLSDDPETIWTRLNARGQVG